MQTNNFPLKRGDLKKNGSFENRMSVETSLTKTIREGENIGK
jgi:hypothetical protein